MIFSKDWSKATEMSAVFVDAPGPHSELRIAPLSVPTPTNTQVLVKVYAAGVNRADLAQRAGIYPPHPGESEVLGLEVAGIVVAVGDDSNRHWLDQAVFGLVPGGGYAEYAVIEADQLFHKPADWSFVQAAATAEVFLTAYQALFAIGGLTAGGAALVHAGASGVGTAAIQLAHSIGAKVAVTVGSTEKAKACKELGASVAIEYKTTDFTTELSQSFKKGFDVIIDPIAADYLAKDLQVLALDGKIVVLAMMGGRKVAEFDLAPMFKKRGQLICSTLRNRTNSYKAELVAKLTKDFYQAFVSGAIKPVIGLALPWQQVEVAHQQIATNQLVGKAVLQIIG
ncbi:MAG: NAD(P)H-quinone oxidoreductase [Gammaproteobacteria bacterium]|nr:NAD(P)H-quinone oxidoreductase [Gammaproteobacteria bacterium]